MRFGASFLSLLLFLLPACAARSANPPYDSGHAVHFLIQARPAPAKSKKPLKWRPVCTAGDVSLETAERRIPGADGLAIVEVAILKVAAGKRVVGIAEPVTRIRGSKTVTIEGDIWVLLRIDPEANKGKFKVYDEPPNEDLGPWSPLVAVPD